MKKLCIEKLLNYHQRMFNELYIIESIINMTTKSCLEREFNGDYYGMSNKLSAKLSVERNHYINLLNVATERIALVLELNTSAENEILLYSKTPTIDADK